MVVNDAYVLVGSDDDFLHFVASDFILSRGENFRGVEPEINSLFGHLNLSHCYIIFATQFNIQDH
jgi:hypothetical protein